mgnify:CR=1 FL=1
MSQSELDKLEQAVERQMRLLAGLPPVTPHPQCLARVKQAVVNEALARGRTARWRRRSAWLSATACLLLAVGLSQVFRVPAPSPLRTAGEEDWAVLLSSAVGESGETLGFLLEEGWLFTDAGSAADAVDRLLESFEGSFEQLGAM